MMPPDEKDLTMSFFIRGSLAHPSSFTKRELFEVHPFREDTKIVGDREFFMYALVQLNASYQALEDIISIFNTEGISSTQQTPDIDKKILSSLLSIEIAASSAIKIDTIKSTIPNCPISLFPIKRYNKVIMI